jgi:hypothetical protein
MRYLYLFFVLFILYLLFNARTIVILRFHDILEIFILVSVGYFVYSKTKTKEK